MDELALAQQAARGDSEAFRTLVEQYRAYIYSIAWQVTLHQEDALDVVQQVYLRLVECIGSFEGRGSFRGWLAALTAHEAVSFRRRAAARHEIPTSPEDMDALAENERSMVGAGANTFSPQGNGPRESILHDERRRHVEAALDVLSPQQRAIFVLRFRAELGPKEIAERLGLPDRQVRSQLHRSVISLRRALAEKGCLE